MDREKHLETVLTISLGLLVVYLFFKIDFLLPVIVVVAGAGLFSHFLAGKIHWLWMTLAQSMGYIMSKVILSVVFFIFLFPLSLLSKFFSKRDSLQLKNKPTASCYTERNHPYVKEDLENPW